jgi:Holliday junction resolvase-like predicted endonuclease
MNLRQKAFAFGFEKEEQARSWFLRQVGGRCIATRSRWKGGEIDLIFEIPMGNHGWELVFVEVRARNDPGLRFGGAIASLGPRKLRRLSLTVERYLARYSGPAQSARFDVLAWDGGRWQHFPNLWPLP